jgi:hypothetical protein
MTTQPPRCARPSSHLVPHEIRLTRKRSEVGTSTVVATVHCERRESTLNVETCGYCERFARIDMHEAGYVMLCRSEDEEPDEPAR